MANLIVSANTLRGMRPSPHDKHLAPQVGHGPVEIPGFSTIVIMSCDVSCDVERRGVSWGVVRKRCCSTASFVKSFMETPVTRKDSPRRTATSPVTVPRRILSMGFKRPSCF